MTRGRSVAAISDAEAAGLGYFDSGECGQRFAQRSPDPEREVLAGRVVESVDFVQDAVIELGMHRRPGSVDVSKIHYPTGHWMNGTAHNQSNRKRVAMHAAARVPVDDVRQESRAGKREVGGKLRLGTRDVGQWRESGTESRSESRTASSIANTLSCREATRSPSITRRTPFHCLMREDEV